MTRSNKTTRHALYPVYVALKDMLLDEHNPDFYAMLVYSCEQMEKTVHHRDGSYTSGLNVNFTVESYSAYLDHQHAFITANIARASKHISNCPIPDNFTHMEQLDKIMNEKIAYRNAQQQYLACIVAIQALMTKHTTRQEPTYTPIPVDSPLQKGLDNLFHY